MASQARSQRVRLGCGCDAMERTLKSRATLFALCAGAAAFFLSLAVAAHTVVASGDYLHALILAAACAAIFWATTTRLVSNTGKAIDAAVERLSQAAHGDLSGPIPAPVARATPPLARAMDQLFGQFRETLDRVERLAMYDAVTGLPNRANFRALCDAVLAVAPPERQGALLFIDLDRFKAVNDTRGHAVGDTVLSEVAVRLRETALRAGHDRGLAPPVVGRLAGDEFTMFLPEVSGSEDIEWVSRRIVALLGSPIVIDGVDIEIGGSVGIALFPAHGRTLHELMRAADAAMYRAKAGGRGRVEVFGAALAADLAARVALEEDLRRAVREGEFSLVFQPQLSLGGDGYVAVETLLRWRHPVDGVRLPGTFLDNAEESGLIVEIGEWVTRQVADTIARWDALGFESRLAINVSPRQIAHADFFRGLREALRARGVPARLIELEIGEATAMSCPDEMVDAIAALREDGATVSIDGFGTGYSNIARLRSLPIDRIKLDRSLIAPIVESDVARSIVQALIGLIHGIGLEAVGEGIETRAQSEVLRVLGCDVIQGFGVAEPMGEEALVAWIVENQPPMLTRRMTSA